MRKLALQALAVALLPWTTLVVPAFVSGAEQWILIARFGPYCPSIAIPAMVRMQANSRLV